MVRRIYGQLVRETTLFGAPAWVVDFDRPLMRRERIATHHLYALDPTYWHGDVADVNDENIVNRALTYDHVGCTVAPDWDPTVAPKGFQSFEANIPIGHGDEDWHDAITAVMHWEVKKRSGFDVPEGDASRVRLGRYWLVARLWPMRIREPVEVVRIVDQEDIAGFAYGTLVGHPVAGEEAFLVSRRDNGDVWFTLRSSTGWPVGLWRVLFPIALLVQPLYRRRYMKALLRDGAAAIGHSINDQTEDRSDR